MIIGAEIGAIIGRKRALAIGCVIYGCGSFTTSIAPNLPVSSSAGHSSKASAPR
jgi:hypothetical protein